MLPFQIGQLTGQAALGAGLPGAPTIGTATAGNGQADFPFTAPASNGGSAIIDYTATTSPGGFTATLTQAGSGTITVTGLSNGTGYTATIVARNAVGTGPASSASNSVTPVAPVYATLDPANKGASVTLSNGNLTTTTNTTNGVVATVAISGKRYWEIPAFLATGVDHTEMGVGLVTANVSGDLAAVSGNAWVWYFGNDGTYHDGSSGAGTGSMGIASGSSGTYTIGFACDADAGTLTLYLNNVSKITFSGLSGTLYPVWGSAASNPGTSTFNFGATAFTYTPPTGYVGVY